MAGVIYVIFSRIVFWVVPPESRTLRILWVPRRFRNPTVNRPNTYFLLPARFITAIFVGFDVVALLLQLVAAVLISGTDPTDANAKDKMNLGKDLGLAGVSIQITGFGLFTIAAIRFHFTSKRLDGQFARMNQAKHDIQRHWSKLLFAVNGSCFLILVCSADPVLRHIC